MNYNNNEISEPSGFHIFKLIKSQADFLGFIELAYIEKEVND